MITKEQNTKPPHRQVHTKLLPNSDLNTNNKPRSIYSKTTLKAYSKTTKTIKRYTSKTQEGDFFNNLK